ncbi:MAG TPA: lipopolysaccharide biosynthesis protein [Candidatus Polarisedimenticolia bacterium]|nr:lipopolysaccharide biosynthesis protein [Candidatus Polarisedimenticolia bacterium]
MSPDGSVSRSAASLLTSRLAVACIALAFLGVSTRLLTLREMAVFAVYNIACGLLTVVCSLGMLASCVKQVPALRAAGRQGEAARLVRLSAAIYAAGAAAATGAAWAAAEPLGRLFLKEEGAAPQVRAAAAAALCFGLYEAVQLLLGSLQRFARQSRDNVLAALAQRILSLALFFPFGLHGYLAGFALGSLGGALSGWSVIRSFLREHRGGASPRGGTREAVAYAAPLYADGYLRYLSMHADQLLVGIVLPPAALSIYFVAKRCLQYGQMLVSSLIDPLAGRAAEMSAADPRGVARLFDASLRGVVLLFLPLSVLLACSAPFLLHVIGGEPYAFGATALGLLLLSLPLFAVFSHLAAFVYILGRPRDRLAGNLAASLPQLAAMAALAPWLGIAGVAAARSIGFAAGAVASARLAAPRLPGARPWAVLRGAAPALAPSALMGAAILLPYGLTGEVLLIPPAAAAGALIAAAGYALVVLSPEDRGMLARMIPGRGRASRRAREAVLKGARGRPTGSI